MPAVSKAQYRYLAGIVHGMKPRGGPSRGPTAAQAKEFIAGQSPRGLPAHSRTASAKRARKRGKS